MHIYLVHCGTNLTKNHNSSIFKPLRSPPQAAMTRRPDLHHGGNSLGQSHSNAGVAQIQTWWYGLPWTMQSYKKLIWHEAVVYIAMHYARQVRWIFPKNDASTTWLGMEFSDKYGRASTIRRQSSASEKNKLIGDRLNKPTKTFRNNYKYNRICISKGKVSISKSNRCHFNHSLLLSWLHPTSRHDDAPAESAFLEGQGFPITWVQGHWRPSGHCITNPKDVRLYRWEKSLKLTITQSIHACMVYIHPTWI